MLGSVDDENSILGRLEAIKSTADSAATTSELNIVSTDLTALAGVVGDTESGLVKTVNDISQGIIDRETGYTELVEQVSGIAEDYGERFEEFDTALEDVVTTEQLTAATQDLATSADIQMLADLIGKPVNEVTQEDIDLATGYLAAVEAEQEVAQQDLLRYDVTGDQLLTQEDVDLLGQALEGDYTGFADTAQFRDTATGMLGREQQLEAELAARDAQILADQQAQAQRDQQLRTQMQMDFQTSLEEQAEAEEQDKLFRAMMAPGRTVTTKPSSPAVIQDIYDFESVFASPEQEGFYRSASPYGEDFLQNILNPQKRAEGGMIKDKTDEILKIIGDK